MLAPSPDTPEKILRVGHCLKMFWVHAGRVAAEMIQVQTGRYRSLGLLVGHPVRHLPLELSVPEFGASTPPDEAALLVDVPEVRAPLKSLKTQLRPVSMQEAVRSSLADVRELSAAALTESRRLLHVGLLDRLTLGGRINQIRLPVFYGVMG